MIKVDNVSLIFNRLQGKIDALKDINLSIPKACTYGIIGHSGAGKSTLVRTLNLLLKPTSGYVYFNGVCLNNLTPDELRIARRQIGMVFQHFNLLHSRTVFDNVALPLELTGLKRRAIQQKIMPLLELVGLAEYQHRFPSQLSGGQKQRVGIARALSCQPKLLLSDEATSALDPETTRSILQLLKTINSELSLTIVLITHQMEAIKQICDQVAVMEKGRIVESGSVADIFLRPNHSVTRRLIGGTTLAELPDTLLKRLEKSRANSSNQNQNRIFRLAYSGDSVSEPLVSIVIRHFGVNFSILHGQVEEIQGQTFGSLIVLASGLNEQVMAALNDLKAHGVVIEELLLPTENNLTSNSHEQLLRTT